MEIEKDIVYSQAVKAGKRIYYLDVKRNKRGELFLSITESKKLVSGEFLVFYNNLTSPDGAVSHTGDNRDGEGDGDDEQIVVAHRSIVQSLVGKTAAHGTVANDSHRTFAALSINAS